MIDSNALYVLTFPSGAQNLALALQIWEDGSLVFHDTCRGHSIHGKITETENGVQVKEDTSGKVFTFKPVTIEAYRRKYKDIAVNGDIIAEECNTTDDLWEYYRRRLREDFR